MSKNHEAKGCSRSGLQMILTAESVIEKTLQKSASSMNSTRTRKRRAYKREDGGIYQNWSIKRCQRRWGKIDSSQSSQPQFFPSNLDKQRAATNAAVRIGQTIQATTKERAWETGLSKLGVTPVGAGIIPC